jgi:hypothetical protein
MERGYVNGNPANLTDPTGKYPLENYGCHDTQSHECREIAKELKEFALQTMESVKNGYLLPVEGFAQIADKAERLFNYQDMRGAMWALTAVIDGMDANIPLLFEQALDDLPYIAENDDPYIQKHAVSSSSVSDLFAGTGLLPYGRYV